MVDFWNHCWLQRGSVNVDLEMLSFDVAGCQCEMRLLDVITMNQAKDGTYSLEEWRDMGANFHPLNSIGKG